MEFSWDRFDDSAIEALTRACGYDGCDDISGRKRWLSVTWPLPTNEFVDKARYAIENVWLRQQPAVTAAVVNGLFAHGIGPRERPKSHGDCLRFLYHCHNKRSLRQLYREAMLRYGCRNQDDDASIAQLLGSGVPRFAKIKPVEKSADDREPYPYQQHAWQALTSALAESEVTGVFEGLLVMPTGSGKTFTAARWLTEHQLNRRRRIVWLAHRHELLEQAAQAFHRCVSLATHRDTIQIRIVSGIHCPATTISPEDDVVLCSVASLARRKDVAEELLNDERTFLVVDEAHHAAAKSYRQLIELIKKRPAHRLLGLTATPTRTLPSEQPILSRIFGGRTLFEVEIRTLIEQRFLARPIPVHVRTSAAVEAAATPEDFRHLQTFAELSEAWLDRIAHITARNEVITRHYGENREKYQKTLIFAINVAHAELLCQRLREEGIEAEYVASYRLSDSNNDNRSIIDRFRRNGSGLDVLINVMILTEGVDIPNVQTVFLTRPTGSEILVRQMVGRALRGPAAGGTETAYLVSFEDQWEEFDEWERPLDLIDDLLPSEPTPSLPEGDVSTEKLGESIPWELIRTTANEMRHLTKVGEVDSFEALPLGWYVVERDDEGVYPRQLIPVYSHQKSCWDEFFKCLLAGSTLSPEQLFDEYFSDCDSPRPHRHTIAELTTHVRQTGVIPTFERFLDRDKSDPRRAADAIWEAQLGPMDAAKLINERYQESLTQAIYATKQDFKEAVQRALDDLADPDRKRRPALGTVVFEPWSDRLLQPGPHHRLPELVEEIRSRGSAILRLPQLPMNAQFEWTRRVVTGWFAKAYWTPGSAHGTGLVRVNSIVDSPDISTDSVLFLLWHEYLHLYLQQGHTPAFRTLERKWPSIIAAERELDTLSERFDIQWW